MAPVCFVFAGVCAVLLPAAVALVFVPLPRPAVLPLFVFLFPEAAVLRGFVDVVLFCSFINILSRCRNYGPSLFHDDVYQLIWNRYYLYDVLAFRKCLYLIVFYSDLFHFFL